MTDTRRRLPPMETIEFAIQSVFRHFFFGLGLALAWAVTLIPVGAVAWFAALRDGVPDVAALNGKAMAALAALAAGGLLASFSIAVNWHRRLLLDETPRRWHRLRLDGVVWRYVAGFVLLLIVLGLYAGAAFALIAYATPALEPHLGPASKPAGIAIATLLGLSALFTFYRLSSWLAAIAVQDEAYTLRAAWRTTRRNRMAYLGFTFWLVFSLAIAGALGAGAFFAQQSLPYPWVKPAAFALMGLIIWLAMFLVMSVAAAHYAHFGRKPVR